MIFNHCVVRSCYAYRHSHSLIAPKWASSILVRCLFFKKARACIASSFYTSIFFSNSLFFHRKCVFSNFIQLRRTLTSSKLSNFLHYFIPSFCNVVSRDWFKGFQSCFNDWRFFRVTDKEEFSKLPPTYWPSLTRCYFPCPTLHKNT